MHPKVYTGLAWLVRALLIILILLLTSAVSKTIIFTNFASGSIGHVTVYTKNYFDLALRDDNYDPSLPDDWRNWWYVKIDAENDKQENVRIDISNRGFNYFTIPFYSYDNKTWHRVNEKNVTQSSGCKQGIKNCILSFSQSLQEKVVYLAAFIPYTFDQLEQYIHKISGHEALTIETLGYSSYFHLPILHLMITDPASTQQIAQVWIQARTHPGETPSNFMIEGFVDFLLSEDKLARILREKIIFHIIPMHNPDGVFVGNYRSNPASINFEEAWFFDENNPAELTTDAPHENQLLNKVMRALLTADIPVKMALNLHASNSEPDMAFFSFPHFGANSHIYTAEQIDLWNKQLLFMDYMRYFYDDKVEPPPQAGYDTFLDDFYPETWWWHNMQNKVMALTVETTYGTAGFDHWITDRELRALGPALAKSIAAYFNVGEPLHLPKTLKNHPHHAYPPELEK